MAVTAKMYGKAIQSILNKEIDIDGDTLKAMLCTSSYTPDQDAHRYKSDITNEVAATGGYAAGGVALTGVTVTYDTATNTVKVDCDDVAFGSSTTITARYAVFYDSTPGSDATRPLIGYWDFGANESSTASPFTLVINAAGLLTGSTA